MIQPGYYLSFFAALFLLSCSSTERPEDVGFGNKPDSVLSENTMVLLLADIHILEAGLNLEKSDDGGVTDRTGVLYTGLFKKYGITKARYDASLKYYNKSPQEFAKLYSKVITQIELKQKQFAAKP
jgi:hypothetical protein